MSTQSFTRIRSFLKHRRRASSWFSTKSDVSYNTSGDSSSSDGSDKVSSPVDSRVWLITGCSSGFGRALVEKISARGERVVATLRKPEVLADLAGKYPTTQLLVLALDVTNDVQIAAVFEEIHSHFGRLDTVINNAGYATQGEMEAIPEEEARNQMEVLFWGPVHITKEAIKFMRDINPPGHGGLVINISSCLGYSSVPALAFYCAGKSALEAFTDFFTREMLPSWNIRGVIVEPGTFLTDATSRSLVRIPVHPKYDSPTSPTVIGRQLLDAEGAATGDVVKGARAILQIADMPNPPLRVPLGTDAWVLTQHAAKQTLADSAKLEKLANSTNMDGISKDAVVKNLKLMLSG
ncbi:hypothetical protein B0H21DRAFT_893982 [Amylocystis lapponica]|nr:hypothetical protein B0H21DRAFT_893982 [Amylocystis lapponica]